MEYIFYNDHRSAAFLIGLLIRMLVFLAVLQFAHANADAKLLATIRTFEDQRLTGFILRFIKGDVLVALRAAYTLHRFRTYL